MTQLALALTMGAVQKPVSLALRALAAVKRAGGTVLAAGAATPVLGPELVTNGDFSNGTTGWTLGTGWSVSSGAAVASASTTTANPGMSQAAVQLIAGRTVLWSLSVSNLTAGVAGFRLYGSGGSDVLFTVSANGTYSGTAVVRSDFNGLIGFSHAAGFAGTIDNISVKEIQGYSYGNPPARNYFDSAGTDILDSVTQVDQPVGLTLDGAGTVGPNVFSDAAVVFGGESSRVSPGVYRIYSSAGAFSHITQLSGLAPYKTYRLRFNVDSVTAGVLAIDGPAGAVVTSVSAGVGEKECVITMTASVAVSIKRSSGVTDIQISNLRIEELPGNHATQPTTGSKPTLRRGLVNQLLWSGDFTNSVWLKQGNATVGALTADPFGGTVARIVDIVQSDARIAQSLAYTAGSTTTFAVWVRKSTTGGANAVRLTTSDNAAWNTGVSQKYTLTSEWQLAVVSGVLASSGTTAALRIGAINAAAGSDADCVGNVDIYRAALYQGTVTAQQIQAAGGIPLTTSAPASSALGNYWWQFDPAAPGDFLQTSITTGNEGWVCAGVNFAPGATLQTVVSSGGGDANQKGVFFFSYNGAALYAYVGNGTARALAQAPISTSVPQVVSMGWSAAGVIAGANNTESTPTAFTGDVTGPLPLRIGQYAGGTATHNGPMSVTVICPTLPPAADRALIRAWVAKQQGQTL